MQGKYSISHKICQESKVRFHLFLLCLLVHYSKVKLFFGEIFCYLIAAFLEMKFLHYVQHSQQGEILALPQTADSLDTFTVNISGALRKIFGG